jgi:hypothetical protein
MFRNVSSWLVPLTVVNFIPCVSITLQLIHLLRDAATDIDHLADLINALIKQRGHVTEMLPVLCVFVKQSFKRHDHTMIEAMLSDVGP